MNKDVEMLAAKLADWKRRLSERDPRAVGTQVGTLLWRSAFYRSLNEPRKFLLKNEEGEKEANAPLYELIDLGFFVVQAAAIRRLLDKGAISGARGVYSLHGLIRDVIANVDILTRRNVLRVRDLEYDFEPIKSRAFETAHKEAVSGISGDG